MRQLVSLPRIYVGHRIVGYAVPRVTAPRGLPPRPSTACLEPELLCAPPHRCAQRRAHCSLSRAALQLALLINSRCSPSRAAHHAALRTIPRCSPSRAAHHLALFTISCYSPSRAAHNSGSFGFAVDGGCAVEFEACSALPPR
eukprot:gene5488-biopygen803